MEKLFVMDKNIKIVGATQNNLKNLNVEFETGKISVVTGVSGSGKSSLVFDTLYAEGQRRYVETFSPYSIVWTARKSNALKASRPPLPLTKPIPCERLVLPWER